jgi:hypothetical protein
MEKPEGHRIPLPSVFDMEGVSGPVLSPLAPAGLRRHS